MRNLCVLLFTALTFSAMAQSEKEAVRQTINTFFKGFHQQDSLLIKSVVADDIRMQTLSSDGEGQTMVRDVDFSRFLKSIVSIPDSISFEEVITKYSIQVDWPMAHAWTDYQFRLNNELSHCGVNSFQLVSLDGQWRILYIIDTRRKDDCQ